MCSKMAKNQKRSPIFFNVSSDVVVKKIRDLKKNVAVSEKLSLIEKWKILNYKFTTNNSTTVLWMPSGVYSSHPVLLLTSSWEPLSKENFIHHPYITLIDFSMISSICEALHYKKSSEGSLHIKLNHKVAIFYHFFVFITLWEQMYQNF